MTINPLKAQDVWKDVGEHVQFTVLKLKRIDRSKTQAAIQEFADRSQAIIRSLRIRDSHLATESSLKVAIGFSETAWEYLFPNQPKPAELETFSGVKGPEY